jgi:gliding motility-associated lipoprotein GldH
MKKGIAILLLSSALFACQPENRVYSENQELSPNVEWLKKDTRSFSVPIEDINPSYKMIVSFRYATGYQFETANIKVTETDPDGNDTVMQYELKVRDSNGDYIGDPALDIWDSEHVVEEKKKFNKAGTYTYVIEQNTPVDPLNFAMEIGLIFDKITE